MLVAGSIALVGAVIQASTYSLGQTLAGRVISGEGFNGPDYDRIAF